MPKNKRKICKMLDEAIADERKAGLTEYPDLKWELQKQNKMKDANIVGDIAVDERRHHFTLNQMKKKLGCS